MKRKSPDVPPAFLTDKNWVINGGAFPHSQANKLAVGYPSEGEGFATNAQPHDRAGWLKGIKVALNTV